MWRLRCWLIQGRLPKAPDDLIAAIPTVGEIVDTLSAVLQRPIRYVDITDEQWADAVKGHLNPHALDHLSDLWRYFRSSEKRSEEARSVTDAVGTVTGSDAQTRQTSSEPTQQNSRSTGETGPVTNWPAEGTGVLQMKSKALPDSQSGGK